MLIGLDSEDCLAPPVAGAKAARLARARAAGLPALPGFVVPVATAADALARGLAQLEVAGRHAGQLEIMTAGTERLAAEPLASELRDRAAALGSSVVVRSSSVLEGDLRWAGAFTSYLGVAPEHAGVAVAGCWASAFSRDALERCTELGLRPSQLALAVLVQPEVRPDLAGTATLEPGGAVRVVGARGSPAQLMSGWDPATVSTVPPGAHSDGTPLDASPRPHARDGIDTETLYAVAALVRTVHEVLGDDTIEWALHEGRVVLLQAGATHPEQAPPRPGAAAARKRRRATLPPESLGLARLAHRFGGATGDALVLPWAVALPELAATLTGPEAGGDDPAAGGDDPAWAWHRAQRLAAELTATAWRARPERARERAAITLAALRTGHTTGARRALQRLTKLAPVEPERARQALALLSTVASSLSRRGLLASAGAFWSLAPEQVTAALERTGEEPAAYPAPGARVAGAWEPFVHAAVITHGGRAEGVPAAPGTAAGTAKLIGDDAAIGETSGRTVWVTSRPLPQFAPVLWHAAALVTAGGSPAAHLVQVARSLHVPAVVSCDLTPLGLEETPRLLAVDGNEGVVAATEG